MMPEDYLAIFKLNQASKLRLCDQFALRLRVRQAAFPSDRSGYIIKSIPLDTFGIHDIEHEMGPIREGETLDVKTLTKKPPGLGVLLEGEREAIL